MRQQAPSFWVRSSLFGLAVPRAGKPRGLSPTHTITSVLSVATIAHEFVCTYTTHFLLIRSTRAIDIHGKKPSRVPPSRPFFAPCATCSRSPSDLATRVRHASRPKHALTKSQPSLPPVRILCTPPTPRLNHPRVPDARCAPRCVRNMPQIHPHSANTKIRWCLISQYILLALSVMIVSIHLLSVSVAV
jgi:hypothetical protein